jgi:hypothetical protein
MRKHYLRILFALIGVAGLGFAAQGQAVDQIVVNIPYEFTVAGKTLPLGTYRLERLSTTDPGALLLSNVKNGSSAIFHSANPAENNSADKVFIGFKQVGAQYFLNKIATSEHMFTISVSRLQILEAATKPAIGGSASGASDGNN